MSSIGKVRRLLQLLERLQSGRVHNARELADFCNVSRRTMFRDLKILQDSGVPILFDAQKQGYWLPTSTFLPPTELTLDETLSLLTVSQESTSASRGVPFREAVRDAALKLLSNLPAGLRQHVGELASRVSIRLEPQPDSKPQRQHYEHILKSLEHGHKIRLRYGSLDEGTEIQTLLSPYRLFFQRRTWYAIGRSSLHRAVRTFHLGRIVASELTTDHYDIPPRFSLQRYFGQAWNMIRERGARHHVVVRFQPYVARNVAEVAWHATQQLTWCEDGTLLFEVEVDGLREIVWWILGYGKQAEALQPVELREMVKQHIREQAAQYGLHIPDGSPHRPERS